MEISIALATTKFAHPLLPSLPGNCEKDGFRTRHPGSVLTRLQGQLSSNVLVGTSADGEIYSISLTLLDKSPGTIGPADRCALIFQDGSLLECGDSFGRV